MSTARSKCSGHSCTRDDAYDADTEPVTEELGRVRVDAKRAMRVPSRGRLVRTRRGGHLDADEPRRLVQRRQLPALDAAVVHHDHVGAVHADLALLAEERRPVPAPGPAQADPAV